MVKTNKVKVISLTKSTLFYSVLFLLTSYSNSLGVVLYASIWIFIVAFLSGIYHRKNINSGIYFYLIPFTIALCFAQIVNYDIIWPIEFLSLLSGFLFGYAICHIKVNLKYIFISFTLTLFSAISVYKYKYYDFERSSQQLHTVLPIGNFELNTDSKITIVQFTSKFCGQCNAQTKFLAEFMLEHEEMNLEIKSVFVAESPDSLLGAEKLKPLINTGAKFILDSNGKLARTFNVKLFPVVFILNNEGDVVFRIDGFSGDMKLAFEEKLIENLQLNVD